MKKLVADCWGCGDDCRCWYTRIREFTEIPEEERRFKSEYGRWIIDDLYEGSWQNDYLDKKTLEEVEGFEEVREEFRQACAEHGIEIDLFSNCHWDWRAEKVIS